MKIRTTTMLLLLSACGGTTDDQASFDAAVSTFDAKIESPDAMESIDANLDEFSVSGPVTGPNLPDDGSVIIAWVVSSGSPDYVYKYGEGVSNLDAYAITLPGTAPPAEAINSYGIGVGIVLLLDDGVVLADGIVDDDKLSWIGISARHAVIWRAQNSTLPSWSAAFPVGMSCGVCLEVEGETFDSFTPVSCSEVEVDTSSDPEVCNWT